MTIDIKPIAQAPAHFVGIRRNVKFEGVGPACAEIFPLVAKWLAERGVAPVSAPATLYHGVNREAGEYDLRPGFFVAEAQGADGDVTPYEVAAGEVLACTHVGPYEKLPETWHAVFAKVEELGREVTRAGWEVYIDDPGEVAPEKLRTEVRLPID